MFPFIWLLSSQNSLLHNILWIYAIYHQWVIASFFIFLWYISITVFISFSFSKDYLNSSSSLLIFSALLLKSTTNSWLLTISVYCLASWIYNRSFSQFSFEPLISVRYPWIYTSNFLVVSSKSVFIFSTKTSFSRVWVRTCTIDVVFFFSLCRSSFLS